MSTDDPKRLVTYAFIDAANVVYRTLDARTWKIDFKKLSKYLKEQFGVSKIFSYGGIDRKSTVPWKIYNKLEEWGYELRLNTVKHFLNKDGEKYMKADVDSRMTFEMMRYLSDYDIAIVMTGDGDFFWVLEFLLKRKNRVVLLANPRKTARELKKLFGSDFANLDNLKSVLEHQK